LADLLEAEPELSQGEHLLQAFDVRLAIEPVARPRALRRANQSNRIVMVERANGYSRCLGKLADLPESHLASSSAQVEQQDKVSRCVRVKGYVLPGTAS